MELKWLEDFLSLASTRSFSKSAEERNTTQSTLSRRIHSLEDWLGVSLVDRSSYPIKLSNGGEQFHKEALGIVHAIFRARAATRSRGSQVESPVRFGAQHVLARYFLPNFLRQIEVHEDIGSAHLKSDNLVNCIEDLTSGHIDFLICYYHPNLPEVVDRRRFPSLVIGSTCAIPVSIPNDSGAPMFALPGSREKPLPYIGFSPDVPLGWHRDTQITKKFGEVHLDSRYESSMGEIVHELIMEGRGFGWLQSELIDDDLKSGRLVPAGDSNWHQVNEIRIFRALGPGRNRIERIWEAISELSKQHMKEHYLPPT